MKSHRFSTFMIFLLVALLILSGCSMQSEQNQEQEVSSTEVGSSVQESSDVQKEAILVETSYGNLSYPYAFEEIVTWEKEENEGVERYIFFAVIDDETIEVYDFIFTEQSLDEATLLGKIEDSSGTTAYVYFSACDEIVSDDMTDTQKDIVYTAQETVNDVISSLYAIPSFVPVDD